MTVLSHPDKSEYIFQIGRDPVTHAATYSMIELPLGHTGSLRVVARGGVNMCSPHATGRSKVSFAYCSDNASDGSWVGSSMVDFVALRAAFYTAIRFVLPDGLLYERRGWFSCDSGCCTA